MVLEHILGTAVRILTHDMAKIIINKYLKKWAVALSQIHCT